MEKETGGWCAPSMSIWDLSLPEIQIRRDWNHWPMPQLDTAILTIKHKRWLRRGEYMVVLRQYGEEKLFQLGPYPTLERAEEALREARSWYVHVYNIIIRTYKATERNKKID